MSRRDFRYNSSKKRSSQKRPESPSPRNQRAHARPHGVSADLVMGRNCVEELLRYYPDRILEIFISEKKDEARAGREDRKNSILDRALKQGLPARECDRRELDSMVHSDSHQGVVARVSPRSFLDLDDLVGMVREERSVRILALDGVLDPQNFGAILRAAECYGVSAVVWSRNRGAPLGPVVAKVSVGASELVPLCPVANLHRALEVLKEAGAWSVGAMVAPDATAVESFEFPEKCVLVMGSEGEGVQQLIERSLDFRVYISMLGKISSLNVSQATTVLLHAMANQHRQKGVLKVT